MLAGERTRGRPKNPVTDAEAEEMRRMYEEEEAPLRMIADRFGRKEKTISIAIKRAGGTIRPPGGRKRPEAPRTPCACQCGGLAKPGRSYLHGHHRRQRHAERREAAEALGVDRADGTETCQYRAARYSSYGRSGDGDAAYSSGGGRENPMCGRPVAVRGASYCPDHASLAYTSDHVPVEELARRLAEGMVQRCARCGREWPTTARQARATWEYHARQCTARAAA